MARDTVASLRAEIAQLRAEIAQGAHKPTATMSEIRSLHAAPCGRGFTTDAKRDEHIAYWKQRGAPCTAKSGNIRGHGPRKGE